MPLEVYMCNTWVPKKETKVTIPIETAWIWTMDLNRGPVRKGLSRNGIGTRCFRPVNLWASRDGPKRVMQDYVDPHFFSSFLILSEKREREQEESDSCDFFPRKHKEFR